MTHHLQEVTPGLVLLSLSAEAFAQAGLSKHNQFRARKYPSTTARKITHLLRVTHNLVMLSLSKHTQFRARKYPSTSVRNITHPLRVDAQPRHAELVEAYPVPCTKIPFDIGSQHHSPAQGGRSTSSC